MPKKTKKQKIRSRTRAEENVADAPPPKKEESIESNEPIPPKKTLHEPDKDVKSTRMQKEMLKQDRIFTSYFLGDLRKTGMAIAIILGIEGFIYYAFQTNMFSVVDNLPF